MSIGEIDNKHYMKKLSLRKIIICNYGSFSKLREKNMDHHAFYQNSLGISANIGSFLNF